MYKKMNTEEKIAIVQQYWAGQSVASLCQQHGVCRSTLYSWLKPFRKLDSSSKCLYSTYTQKDRADLKRHAEKLECMLEVLRQCDCGPNSPLDDRIAAFQTLQGQYSARTLCDALNIPRSTYHKQYIRLSKVNTLSLCDRVSICFDDYLLINIIQHKLRTHK